MSKEQATLLGELMMLKAQHPTFKSKIGFVDGKVFFEVEPVEQPFAVKESEVHMELASVDYEVIGRDLIAKLSYLSDDIAELRAGLSYISQRLAEKQRKNLSDTAEGCTKSWHDDIASASAEKSDNLKVDVESIKVEGALTPDDVAQAYLETIGETTGPSSDIVISIGTLNVNVN